jgi:hypothetical protein
MSGDLRNGDLIVLKPSTKLMYDTEEGCIVTDLCFPVTSIIVSAYHCPVHRFGDNSYSIHHEHAVLMGGEICYVESDQMVYDLILPVQDPQRSC